MDRKIEKKRWNSKRITFFAGGAFLALLIGFAVVTALTGERKYNVSVERITISEISRGPFQEFVPLNGVVMPQITIFLDAIQGGTVMHKYVEDGAVVRKGDPIVKLANTDVELNLANSETQLYNLQTQMQISKNNSAQNTVNKLQTMADVESAYREAERVYDLDRKLFAEKAIGQQEYRIAENNYTYQTSKRKLAKEILRQDSIMSKTQSLQAQEQYRQMKNALELMRKEVADLTVKAPMDGQLTSLDAEVGQNKNRGDHLAQIDGFSGLKVRALVDEHYIARVLPGLTAYYGTESKTYQLTVKKVYTQVSGGQFQVDMLFKGPSPPGLRKGQTLQIRLAFSDESPAILLPRGGFYQQTGGNWIFKLSPDGKTAYKADIQLNRQNPDYFEVSRGLKPGDKVITSGYETFGDSQELILQK